MTNINNLVFVLGASDSEVDVVEKILKSVNAKVIYASKNGKRVEFYTAYEADPIENKDNHNIIFVRCQCIGSENPRIIIHQGPERSIIHQVIGVLNENGIYPEITPDLVRSRAKYWEVVSRDIGGNAYETKVIRLTEGDEKIPEIRMGDNEEIIHVGGPLFDKNAINDVLISESVPDGTVIYCLNSFYKTESYIKGKTYSPGKVSHFNDYMKEISCYNPVIEDFKATIVLEKISGIDFSKIEKARDYSCDVNITAKDDKMVVEICLIQTKNNSTPFSERENRWNSVEGCFELY